MGDINTNSHANSESTDEDDDELWNLFESEALNTIPSIQTSENETNQPTPENGSNKPTPEDLDSESEDDLWDLFENVFPDDSKSTNRIDDTCSHDDNSESNGKHIFSANSSLHSKEKSWDKDVNKVTLNSHENENRNIISSSDAVEKQHNFNKVTCKSLKHDSKIIVNTNNIQVSACRSDDNYEVKNSGLSENVLPKEISKRAMLKKENGYLKSQSAWEELKRLKTSRTIAEETQVQIKLESQQSESSRADAQEHLFIYDKKEMEELEKPLDKKDQDLILKIALNKSHVVKEDGIYFCNLCSTTSLNIKSLYEHIKGKKHEKQISLSSKGIFNQSYENYYYERLKEEVLSSSSKETNEIKSAPSIDNLASNLKYNDNHENQSKIVHITEESFSQKQDMLSSCEDSMILEAVKLGHIELDTSGELICTVCNVSSTKWTTIRIHLKGKKHQLKASEVSESQENGKSSCDTNSSDILSGYFINMTGIPSTATEHDIIEFFSPIDIVSIRFIVNSTEEDLSSHLGEADVEFISQDDATIAMSKEMSLMSGNIIYLTQISTSLSSKHIPNTSQANYPPPLRLVVTDSLEDNIGIGTVIVLTSDDATIMLEPRDMKKLKNIDMNNNETVFYVHEIEVGSFQYCVRDHGSNGGTIVNGIQISAHSSASQYFLVNHGDTVQCGLVKLLCHIHPNTLFCFDCEQKTKKTPGTSSKLKHSKLEQQVNMRMKDINKEEMEFCNKKQNEEMEYSRRNELKSIRKKYGLTYMYDMVHVSNNPNYKDRAGKRRKIVGSDNPFEKTEVAHTSVAITKKNKGFKMLAAMGWKEGESLGRDNSGMLEPIRGDEVKNDRIGLGSSQMAPPLTPRSWGKKQNILSITKERFYKE